MVCALSVSSKLIDLCCLNIGKNAENSFNNFRISGIDVVRRRGARRVDCMAVLRPALAAAAAAGRTVLFSSED